MMTKSDPAAAQFRGLFEKDLPPQPRAKETGVFPFIRTVGPWADITADGDIIKMFGNKKGLHLLCRFSPKTGINMDGRHSVCNGHPFQSFPQEPQQ